MTRNHTYRSVEVLVFLALPLFGLIYFLFDLPYRDEVIFGVLTSLWLLGILIVIRTRIPYAGNIEIRKSEEGVKVFSLVLDFDIDDLEKQDNVIFRITPK